MAKLGSDGLVIPQDVNATLPNTLNSQTMAPGTGLGSRASTPDGRVYRYAQVGASNLVAGNVIQGTAPVANHQHLTPLAAAGTGTYIVQVTTGATQTTAGFYANGYMVIDSGSGDLGYTYSIVNNSYAVSSGTPIIYLGEPLVNGLKTSDTVSLIPNPYGAVIQAGTWTNLTGPVVGVALTAATASYYCWLQTRGICSVLSDATIAAQGGAVSVSATTVGSVTATSGTNVVLGVASVAGVSGRATPVFLTLE